MGGGNPRAATCSAGGGFGRTLGGPWADFGRDGGIKFAPVILYGCIKIKAHTEGYFNQKGISDTIYICNVVFNYVTMCLQK